MQRFLNNVPGALDLQVTNFKPYAITWGTMADLLKGLLEYCSVQLCQFEFSVGSGVRIGQGGLYKP